MVCLVSLYVWFLVRFAARLVQATPNGVKIGAVSTGALLNILHDQFQNNMDTGRSGMISSLEDKRYAAFMTYIAQCLAQLARVSSEACDVRIEDLFIFSHNDVVNRF
jgi:hypothetical protein